jgi:hypothetical protein
VEADLARYYGRDLRDHWRHDERGRRRLTLRQLSVMVHALPVDSSVAMLNGPGWTVGDYLLADVFLALTGESHPADPRPKGGTVSEEQRRAFRARQEDRKARLAAKKRSEEGT